MREIYQVQFCEGTIQAHNSVSFALTQAGDHFANINIPHCVLFLSFWFDYKYTESIPLILLNWICRLRPKVSQQVAGLELETSRSPQSTLQPVGLLVVCVFSNFTWFAFFFKIDKFYMFVFWVTKPKYYMIQQWILLVWIQYGIAVLNPIVELDIIKIPVQVARKLGPKLNGHVYLLDLDLIQIFFFHTRRQFLIHEKH